MSLRNQFPFLEHKGKTQKSVAYLDSAASSQKPTCVLDAMRHAYETSYANVHRGIYDLANKATDHYERARLRAQKFIGASHAEEVIFTRNTTEAINLVASSYLAPHIKPGDEIILSIAEHHANIVPWHFLRERFGAQLIWAPVEDDGQIIAESFEKLFSSKTKMLAITHMSNVLGTVTPIQDIIRMSHAHNVPVLVDGAQAAAHLPIHVQDLGCDFYTFTSHKVYGPSGIGILYGKKQHLESMRPYQGGGEMISTVTRDHVEYADLPYKFEAGTPAIVDAVGLEAGIDFIESIGWKTLKEHDTLLGDVLISALSSIHGLSFVGDPYKKRGIFSFTLSDIHPHDIAMFLNQYDIAIRAGHHCAQPLVERFGFYATCRASVGIYNNIEDIERLAEALHAASLFFGKKG